MVYGGFKMHDTTPVLFSFTTSGCFGRILSSLVSLAKRGGRRRLPKGCFMEREGCA